MPSLNRKLCAKAGCFRPTLGTYCDKHRKAAREYDRHRPSAAKRGYGRRWRKARKRFLAENPLCVKCQRRGRTVAATVVDHIVPHKGDPELFWDDGNWQSLCKTHHDEKTAREGAFGRDVES